MGLKATCPNNPNHKRFETTAHVMQAWEVDEEGNFMRLLDSALETTHDPDPGNIWTCVKCGAQAKVEAV